MELVLAEHNPRNPIDPTSKLHYFNNNTTVVLAEFSGLKYLYLLKLLFWCLYL